jgi:hypothetical protein
MGYPSIFNNDCLVQDVDSELYQYLKRFESANELSAEQIKALMVEGLRFDKRFYNEEQRSVQKAQFAVFSEERLRYWARDRQKNIIQLDAIISGKRNRTHTLLVDTLYDDIVATLVKHMNVSANTSVKGTEYHYMKQSVDFSNMFEKKFKLPKALKGSDYKRKPNNSDQNNIYIVRNYFDFVCYFNREWPTAVSRDEKKKVIMKSDLLIYRFNRTNKTPAEGINFSFSLVPLNQDNSDRFVKNQRGKKNASDIRMAKLQSGIRKQHKTSSRKPKKAANEMSVEQYYASLEGTMDPQKLQLEMKKVQAMPDYSMVNMAPQKINLAQQLERAREFMKRSVPLSPIVVPFPNTPDPSFNFLDDASDDVPLAPLVPIDPDNFDVMIIDEIVDITDLVMGESGTVDDPIYL